MQTEPRIAIVGIGGVFPAAPDVNQFWANVAAGVDASSAVPPGRWALHPAKVVSPGLAIADKVNTSRGYYLDDVPIDCSNLNLDADFLDRLDPVFRLIVAAGKQAWENTIIRHVNPRRA